MKCVQEFPPRTRSYNRLCFNLSALFCQELACESLHLLAQPDAGNYKVLIRSSFKHLTEEMAGEPLTATLIWNRPPVDQKAKMQIKEKKEARVVAFLARASCCWLQLKNRSNFFVMVQDKSGGEKKSILDCGKINTPQVCSERKKARNPERLVLIKRNEMVVTVENSK